MQGGLAMVVKYVMTRSPRLQPTCISSDLLAADKQAVTAYLLVLTPELALPAICLYMPAD